METARVEVDPLLPELGGLGGRSGDGWEVAESQVVYGLVEILNSRVRRHGDSSVRVAAPLELVLTEMYNK